MKLEKKHLLILLIPIAIVALIVNAVVMTTINAPAMEKHNERNEVWEFAKKEFKKEHPNGPTLYLTDVHFAEGVNWWVAHGEYSIVFRNKRETLNWNCRIEKQNGKLVKLPN